MSKQQERQNAVRLLTGTAYNYSDDWHALFDADGIAEGPYNERLRTWINGVLGTSYLNVNDAMRMFAIDQGFTRWAEMGDFIVGARITLDDTTVTTDALVGDLVGLLDVVNGSGPYTFSITADPSSKFVLDLVDNTRLELEATVTVGTYSVTIEADNGVDAPISRTFTITAEAPADVTAPTITSANSDSMFENAQLSFVLSANETVTWSIVGGADAAQFQITGAELQWASDGTRDYENPLDANADNAYVVTVRATDASSNFTDQTITVTVFDVAEGGGATDIEWGAGNSIEWGAGNSITWGV